MVYTNFSSQIENMPTQALWETGVVEEGVNKFVNIGDILRLALLYRYMGICYTELVTMDRIVYSFFKLTLKRLYTANPCGVSVQGLQLVS